MVIRNYRIKLIAPFFNAWIIQAVTGKVSIKREGDYYITWFERH